MVATSCVCCMISALLLLQGDRLHRAVKLPDAERIFIETVSRFQAALSTAVRLTATKQSIIREDPTYNGTIKKGKQKTGHKANANASGAKKKPSNDVKANAKDAKKQSSTNASANANAKNKPCHNADANANGAKKKPGHDADVGVGLGVGDVSKEQPVQLLMLPGYKSEAEPFSAGIHHMYSVACCMA